MPKARNVTIIGGGVIGLSIAYVLAKAGLRPTVLDRREPGREASWAGAGLIPPVSERRSTHPMLALRGLSTQLYSEWAASLQEETGIDIGYRRSGGVDVAWTEAEEQILSTTAGRWRVEGIAYERLAPRDYSRVEPALNPELRVAYFLPDRAQVRNPWLLRALMAAITGHGGRIEPFQPVEKFDVERGRITALHTPAGKQTCDIVIMAAGSWSGPLLNTIGVKVPTPPLKGQIVLLRGERPLLRRIVEHGKNYLVPRDDGRVLVGATEENAGYDTETTPGTTADLVAMAHRLCPTLAEARVEKTWAGLRPGSVDTRPYIGRAVGFENLIVATGHKRAGLQLAPATAELVGDLVLGRAPQIDLEAFRPGREPDHSVDEVFRS
jgi:glycine oxidase